MPSIPGLPTQWTCRDGTLMDLTQVPQGPVSDHDPVRPEKVDAWGRWAAEVFRYRRIRRLQIKNDPKQEPIEWAKCKKYGPKYFITVWCFVNEPRKRRFNEVWALVAPSGTTPENPGWLPAIPFEYQVTILDWAEMILNPQHPLRRGAVSKPRDMGVSWWLCLLFLAHFILDDMFSAKYISRREDEVWKTRKLNCLFGRTACHLLTGLWPAATLPAFLRPEGWLDKDHLQELMMTHPENENIITGEATTGRAGRGDRAEIGLIDEAAHIRDLRELMGGIAQTVDALILVSSEYVGTTDFWPEYVDALKQEFPATADQPGGVFELDYWMHPFHDERYLDEERAAMNDDEAFAREILRDRWAGFSGWLYEAARDIQPLTTVKAFEEGTKLAVGFDPGQDDETAMAAVELNSISGRDTVLEAYAKRGMTPEWWACLLLGCNPDDTYLDPLGKPYHFTFTHRERDLLEWFRSHPQVQLYADPYGENAIKKKGETYYNDMRLFALKHNWRKDIDGNPKPLSIVCGWDHDQRHFQKRRMKTMRWLPRLQWNPTPDVIKTLHALKNSRFDDPDKARQSEQRDAKHDANSHRRTSIEFLAVNLDIAYRNTTDRAQPYQGTGDREVRGRRDDPEQRAA
jgi:hypothetical protein